jgi:hypothetical protein
VASATTTAVVYRNDVSVVEVGADMGITDEEGGIAFDWCLDCGQLQGEWPRPRTPLDDDDSMRPSSFKRYTRGLHARRRRAFGLK